jgi:hypothetical protein
VKANWSTLILGRPRDELFLQLVNLPSVSNVIGFSGAVARAVVCAMPKVKKLTLNGDKTELPLDTVHALARSMPNLSSVCINMHSVPWPLSELALFTQLRSLDVYYNDCEDVDVEPLACLGLESLALSISRSHDLRLFNGLLRLRLRSFFVSHHLSGVVHFPSCLLDLDLTLHSGSLCLVFDLPCCLQRAKVTQAANCVQLFVVVSVLLSAAQTLIELQLPFLVDRVSDRATVKGLLVQVFAHPSLQFLTLRYHAYFVVLKDIPPESCRLTIFANDYNNISALPRAWQQKVQYFVQGCE